MATGLSVNVQEFDTYDFKGDATQELIFSLREASKKEVEEFDILLLFSHTSIFYTKQMLSFLAFCEALDLPYFQLFFSESGRYTHIHT